MQAHPSPADELHVILILPTTRQGFEERQHSPAVPISHRTSLLALLPLLAAPALAHTMLLSRLLVLGMTDQSVGGAHEGESSRTLMQVGRQHRLLIRQAKPREGSRCQEVCKQMSLVGESE